MYDLFNDSQIFLRHYNKEKTAAHCRDVATEAMAIAEQYGIEREPLETAALLHDICAPISPSDMLAYAEMNNWQIDPAARRYPFLLHQRLSAVLAKDLFGVTDALILDAISHHTTLRAAATPTDIALFLADKLAWDQAGKPPFAESVRAALSVSLAHAAHTYIEYVFDHGMILCPHQLLLDARAYYDQERNRRGDL